MTEQQLSTPTVGQGGAHECTCITNGKCCENCTCSETSDCCNPADDVGRNCCCGCENCCCQNS